MHIFLLSARQIISSVKINHVCDISDLQSNVTELINADAAFDDRIINLEEAVNGS